MPMPVDIAAVAWRPTVTGSTHAAATGHQLATFAAMRILDGGGNAIDAGVTAAMALSVLQPDVVSFAGVAPTLVYLKSGEVVSLAGLGYWPAGTDIAALRRAGTGSVPEGVMRQIIPAAPATHIEALRRFGTISFEQAASAARDLARDGFAVYPQLADVLEAHGGEIDRFATNAAIFRPGGKTPPVGSVLRQLDLARTIDSMIAAEREHRGDRDSKLRAVHDFFYKGPIAQRIVRFHEEAGGFIRAADLRDFQVPVEASISTRVFGLDVHACDVWCQGIVLLEALKLLEGVPLREQGHNSTAHIHWMTEALNLAFADREAFIGDPRFVQVPTQKLLSQDYANAQRARIDRTRALGHMYGAGEGLRMPAGEATRAAPDTIYAAIMDRYGNGYSATPSDTMYDSPMVPDLGFVVSTRGAQSRLEPDHPAVVAPGKRPRLTPTPAMALDGGKLRMAWGTPGGDVQCQAMLQVFLNIAVFGMAVQPAIEAPRIGTFNFPGSFAPHPYHPGRLYVEDRIAQSTREALAAMGHNVQTWSSISWSAGAVCAIWRDPATGQLHAGADPRRSAYAMAW